MVYKTFEDMKHNIPEGATHYRNECESFLFTWFKETDSGIKFYEETSQNWRLIGRHVNNIKSKMVIIPIQIETPEEKEALDMIDTTSKQVESLVNNSESPNSSKYDRAAGGPIKLSPPEWDGWDEEGYAECIPHEPGINVLAFIDAKVNGTNGSRGRWVEAKTVCSCYASNGGAQVVVEFAGRNYAISAITYLRKPESPEQKAERERLEAAYDLCTTVYPDFSGFDEFKKATTTVNLWLAIVDKTGYRKE